MGIYRKIDKTVILHINSHLSVHTSVLKSCVCTRAITFGLCCFGTVFRLHRYTHSRPQSPSFLGHVVGKRGCILTYLSILRLIPIQTLVIWLLVGCCESGCPVIKVTLVKYERRGRIDLGSCPYCLSQENLLAIPLCMHGGYVGCFLLSIKLINSFLLFLIKKLMHDSLKTNESIFCSSLYYATHQVVSYPKVIMRRPAYGSLRRLVRGFKIVKSGRYFHTGC